MDPFSLEFGDAVFVAVVYQVVSFAEVLAVGDDHFLVEDIVKIVGDPFHLIAPC